MTKFFLRLIFLQIAPGDRVINSDILSHNVEKVPIRGDNRL